MKYTHVFVKGDAHTPQRFWEYVPLTESQIKSFPRNDGFIRKITDSDKKMLNLETKEK